MVEEEDQNNIFRTIGKLGTVDAHDHRAKYSNKHLCEQEKKPKSKSLICFDSSSSPRAAHKAELTKAVIIVV